MISDWIMARSSWSYQQPQPDSGYFSPHSGDMASLQFHFDESLQDHQETSAFSYGSMEEPIDKQLQFEPSMTSTPALDIQQGQLFRRRQHRSDPQLFPSRPPTCQKAQYHSHGHLCQPQVIWVGSATRATRSAATQTADSFRCANCQPNNSVGKSKPPNISNQVA